MALFGMADRGRSSAWRSASGALAEGIVRPMAFVVVLLAQPPDRVGAASSFSNFVQHPHHRWSPSS